jgi:hypothetical protein
MIFIAGPIALPMSAIADTPAYDAYELLWPPRLREWSHEKISGD